MSRPKRLLHFAGFSLGIFGIVVCVVALIILWMASIRLGRAADRLFSKMDKSLAVVQQRVIRAQERIAAARANTGELDDSLRDWAQQETAQRLALRLNAAEKSERLLAVLQQANDSFEVAESSVGFVQDMLSINDSTGAPSDTTLVDRLMEEIVSLRAQLNEVTESVGTIHDRLTEISTDTPLEERFAQALPLTLRVVAALGTLEPRLQKFTDNIAGAQNKAQALGAKVQRWILVVTIGITLLILLMAAGQVALCRLAWTSSRKREADLASA